MLIAVEVVVVVMAEGAVTAKVEEAAVVMAAAAAVAWTSLISFRLQLETQLATIRVFGCQLCATCAQL